MIPSAAHSETRQSTWYSSAAGIVEPLLKISGALAAVGFIALRAYLSRFGLSELSSPSTGQYMATFYALLTDVIFHIQVLLPVIAILWLLGAALIGRSIWARRIEPAFRAALTHWATPAILAGGILSFAIWFLGTWSRSINNSLVGDLWGIAKADQQGGALLAPLCCVVLCGALVCWGESHVPGRVPLVFPSGFFTRGSWLLCRFLVITLGIYAPMIYGRFVLDPNYPVVTVQRKDKGVCGLLMPSGSNDFLLWQLDGTQGQLILIPRSEVINIVIGPVNTIGSVAEDFKSPCTMAATQP